MGRKIWSKLNKYQFMVFFLAGGILFLSLSHNWKLYGDPMKEIGRGIWRILGVELTGAEEQNLPEPEDVQPAEPAEAESQPAEELREPQGLVEEPVVGPAEEPVTGEEKPDMVEVQWGTVEDDYFRDALFIGDSRTVGLQDYGKLQDTATFYASTGLTIFRLFTAEIVEAEGQRKKLTVEEALSQNQFAKIYLMVGINELGTGDVERFEKAYGDAIQRIRELQPDAIIYIQSILRVTNQRSQKGDYITNEGIDARNEAICQLADDQTIFYLDVNEVVCDESGGMNPEYTWDGVHLKAKFIPIWKDYLKSHAVVN